MNARPSLFMELRGQEKAYLLNHVAQIFDDRLKLFLANTNPAVDNLRCKIRAQNCEFSTIAKFLGKKRQRLILMC